MNLGYTDNEVLKWFYKGLCEVNREHNVTEWIELIMEFGQVNFKCMELLDKANTESFGNPVPTRVNVDIKKGPFIVVSGHDLNDLSQLLEQTEKTGVNVYTTARCCLRTAIRSLTNTIIWRAISEPHGRASRQNSKIYRAGALYHQLSHAAKAELQGQDLHHISRGL